MSKSENLSEIKHTGLIVSLSGNTAQVQIEQLSACAECHAKSACTIRDKADKLIEVQPPDNSYAVGDKVLLYGAYSLGLKAVLYAFVFPFIVIVATLFIGSRFFTEIQIAVLALSTLVPYYGILYLLRKKFKRIFTFTIKKFEE